MTRLRVLFVAAAATPALLWAQAAAAQTPPPPPDPAAIGRGLIEQQQRTTTPPQRPATPAPVSGEGVAKEADPDESASQVSFVLNRVEFGPSEYLSRAELDALAAPLVGRDVGIADLRGLVSRINAVYADRGILTARAFLPPQRIQGGIVRIDLVEGRLSELSVAPGRYTDAAYVRPRVDLRPGELVDLARLRRSLERFNRSNDVRLQAELRPGAQVGQTDVLLSVQEPPQGGGQLFVDSHGYESTGRTQGGLLLRRNTFLTQGDRFNLFVSGSDGGLTGSLTYNLPIGRAGGRLGLTYAHSDVAVNNGPSARLNITGFSDTLAANYARPLFGGERWTVTGLLSTAAIWSTNEIATITVGSSDVYEAATGLSASAEFGRLSLGWTQTVGLGRFEDSLDPGFREFVQTNVEAVAGVRLTERWGARLFAVGQYTDMKQIASSQLFQIGGPLSVRGYQPGSASGASGWFAQATAGRTFQLQGLEGEAFAFVDGGQTFSADFGDRGLTSAGVGLRVQRKRIGFEAVYGRALSGLPQSESRDRVDARLTFSF